MKKRTFAVLVALLTFVVGVAIARFTLPRFRTPAPPPPPAKHEIQLSNYRLSGPYQHENLTIFLVHGPDQPFSGPYTPLQQALERKVVAVYETSEVNELASAVVDGQSDVIGFVFAINNELNSADVYPSNAMFKQFWPRLLKAAAVEAVAETSPAAARPLNEALSIDAAGEFLVAAEKGTESLNEVTKRTHMVKRESEKGIFFETRDMAHNGAWIHRNYLTR